MKSPFKHPFWDAFRSYGPKPKCKDELLIVDISKSIRSKPNWKSKYKDEEIKQKWANEIKEQMRDKTKSIGAIIEYVFEELKWYEKLEDSCEGFLDSGFSLISDEGLVTSDSAISENLRLKLSSETKQLYNSFGDNLDYHPNSNQQVIDLVHPSLFPLQYGRTPIKSSKGFEVIQFNKEISEVKSNIAEFGVSKNFQWLPSILSYNKELEKYEFSSYINNLHPIEFSDLYDYIAKVFTSALPGLNLCLSRASSEQYLRIEIPEFDEAYTDEFQEKLTSLEDELLSENEDEFNEKVDELYETRGKYVKDIEIKYKEDTRTNNFDLKSMNDLKVVVKLANIELTSENPHYKGGTWHVEGTINEDIIATVLYYYDMENISESHLSFRKATEDPSYEQNDKFYCEHFYGLHDEDELYENMGSTEAKQGRMVVFPNTSQHHVDSFDLLDKTKNGYRKILCFFIVDPFNDKVLATDQVPPQQEHWWNDNALADLISKELKVSFKPQDIDEAKNIREQLMSERSIPYADEDGLSSLNRSFSLCEH